MPDTPSTRHAHLSSSWHFFSWDGICFPLPSDWNLASYRMDRRSFQAVIEDDIAVRLEIEWAHAGRNPPDLDRLVRRSERRLRKLRCAASCTRNPDGVPDNWRAQCLDMPDSRRLVIAIGHIRDTNLTALLRFHFGQAEATNLSIVRRVLAETRLDAPAARQWQVYDCTFRIHPAFSLLSTEFVAGRKLFVFGWRGRVLTIWFVSFADRALRDRSLAQWAADFLNRQPVLRGPQFVPDGADRLAVRRARWFPFGHYAELLRGCRSYHTSLHRLPGSNQIVAAVFQHRDKEDLRLLQELEWSLQ